MFLDFRCFSHVVNLLQGEFIKKVSPVAKMKQSKQSPAAASTTTRVPKGLDAPEDSGDEIDEDEKEEDEEEVLDEIEGFDADSSSPFPAGSLLFKCRAFIAKVCSSWPLSITLCDVVKPQHLNRFAAPHMRSASCMSAACPPSLMSLSSSPM